MPYQEPSTPPPPKKGILHFRKPQQPAIDLSGITNDINTLSRRLRLVEESSTNIKKFFQVTQENVITKNKHYSAEIKTITSDISEIRKEIHELREKLFMVIRELQTVARREEVKVLEKYINLWNPLRFVTQNEVEQIINEVLEKRSNRKV